jgi:biopolymer transport protein ExbB
MESWHGRTLALVIGLLLLAIPEGLGLLAPTRAAAQDGLAARKTDDPADGAASDSDAGAPRSESRESFFQWMIRASGLIGIVIAAMSFYLAALVVWMAIRYRRSAALPRRLIREVQELLDQRRYSDAYSRAAADSSLFGRVLAAGVRKLPGGMAQAQRAMEMANEDVTMEMEHRTTYLATVGTLGPMIGLVGTVYGMIKAFSVIATAGSSPQASQLAEGISTALFATLEGIAISIPAIYFYSFFRNRIARLSLEATMAAEPLLEQFAPGVKPQEPSAPASPSPPAAPMPATGTHPHPFALNAALAATAGAAPRSALPPAQPE